MAYIKTDWISRVRQYANRVVLTATGGTDEFDSTQVEGIITTPGTPFSPANMNKIEDQLELLDTDNTSNKEDLVYSTDAVGTNTLTATNSKLTALFDGLKISLDIQNDNTSAVTLNINSYGAKDVKYRDADGILTALSGTELQADSRYPLEYDGTQFIMIAQLPTPSFEGAILYKTADQNISTGQLVIFEQVLYNYGCAVTTTRITVPDGAKKIIAKSNFEISSTVNFEIIKNGIGTIGLPVGELTSGDLLMMVSAPVEVVDNDYFEIKCYGNDLVKFNEDGASTQNRAWFALEVIE